MPLHLQLPLLKIQVLPPEPANSCSSRPSSNITSSVKPVWWKFWTLVARTALCEHLCRRTRLQRVQLSRLHVCVPCRRQPEGCQTHSAPCLFLLAFHSRMHPNFPVAALSPFRPLSGPRAQGRTEPASWCQPRTHRARPGRRGLSRQQLECRAPARPPRHGLGRPSK